MFETCKELQHRHDEPDARAHGGGHGHAPDQAESPGERALDEWGLQARRSPLEAGAANGKWVYFDAFSGAGGDMCAAALVDLGVPFGVMVDAVSQLQLNGVRPWLHAVQSSGIAGLKFEVDVVEGSQPERSYAAIVDLLQRSQLRAGTRELALRIFARLARAESQVHHVALEAVHFHEVGAADSLVDIVAVAAALDYLGGSIVCSPLPLGHGFVRCQHGLIPVPAPATVLCTGNLTTIDGGVAAELLTPTAAAILGETARTERWPAMAVERTGWGAGSRALPDRPNLLRVVLGQPATQFAEATAAKDVVNSQPHQLVETNLDDVTGELLGHSIERLMAVGALDAWATPCVMKKGRPGWTLSALGTVETGTLLAEVLLRETSSIGVRFSTVSRMTLQRQVYNVQTAYGVVPIKLSAGHGGALAHAKPEFDVCRALAEQHSVPVRVVVQAALNALEQEGDKG
jgi:pyridinium-3,5-bisthiocarboxylic acid mononucleotide nickel chelatase